MTYTIYAWHKGIAEERFDAGMTYWLQHELSLTKHTDVYVNVQSGNDAIYKNADEVARIPHGSITIIQNDDTLQFHISDFGDNCADIYPFTQMKNFASATVGQYNRYKLNRDLPKEIFDKIRPGYYPETNWDMGNQYYDTIQHHRASIQLDKRLHFRGSVYPVIRDCIPWLTQLYGADVYMGMGRLPFTEYIEELAQFRMTLSLGMSPYHSDLCFRDIEVFGLGIPVIRPKLHVELADPLIPDVHYIACNVDLDPYTLWAKNTEDAARKIYERYLETIDNVEFLNYISTNARMWYTRNIANGMPARNLASWVSI